MSKSPQYGVSFSIKQCRDFKLDPKQTLHWLVYTLGFKRIRLMSYWNEHEKTRRAYDFSELDWQIEMARKNNCTVSLCLGARQPRWPENHWPDWAWQLEKTERSEKLLQYVAKVIKHYQNNPVIVSWQLENEALLSNFGERSEIDRDRLKAEYALVKKLDPKRPIIMTTSTSWGIPIHRPIPDIVGFSMYNIVFNKGRYRRSLYIPFVFWARAMAIWLMHRRQSFIHELQLEPWGPQAIWEMSTTEQNKSMNVGQLKTNIALANKTKLNQIDFWGGEWWYWRELQGDSEISAVIKELLA